MTGAGSLFPGPQPITDIRSNLSLSTMRSERRPNTRRQGSTVIGIHKSPGEIGEKARRGGIFAMLNAGHVHPLLKLEIGSRASILPGLSTLALAS